MLGLELTYRRVGEPASAMGQSHLMGVCVGVYMQAMISIYGRRMDRGLKYLLIEDTGSGSFPLP